MEKRTQQRDISIKQFEGNMKLLIIRTFPDILNPETYNIQEIGLAKALTRKGIECGIVLYYGRNQDAMEHISVDCGGETREITIYRLHGYNFLKNGIFPSLQKIIKEYDIIQVHEYDQITSWRYYAWSKKPVVIYHGPYYHSFNKGYNLKCKLFDNTFLKLKKNPGVPCVTKSRAAAQFLEEKGFHKVTPVGVGLDIENLVQITDQSDVRTDKAGSLGHLLYVGKLEERRNLFFLLEVFRGLLQKDNTIELTIIGNGENHYKEAFLKEAEDLIRENKLHYIEKISQKELGTYYLQADIMVFPSQYEIFGMVLLEALYYNLPVVSSDNGGADMLIHNQENGLIIPQFDCKMWVERIYALLSDSKQYGKIKNHLQREDKRRLTWDGIADVMAEQYEKAMKR